MLSTKTRNTIIALVASFSVAGVAVPTVAQAEPKSSGAPSQQETCDKLYGQFEHWVNLADALYKAEGNGGTFKAVLDTAESTLHEAENQGCDWAARTQPPSKRLPVYGSTAVGTLQVSTAGTTAPSRVTKLSARALLVR